MFQELRKACHFQFGMAQQSAAQDHSCLIFFFFLLCDCCFTPATSPTLACSVQAAFSRTASVERWQEPQHVSMLLLGLTASLQQVGGHCQEDGSFLDSIIWNEMKYMRINRKQKYIKYFEETLEIGLNGKLQKKKHINLKKRFFNAIKRQFLFISYILLHVVFFLHMCNIKT